MATNLMIAQTIANQIGSRAFIMMGTKHKLGGENFLSFDIHGSKKFSKVQVTLEPCDTYLVEFFKFRQWEISNYYKINDIYAENLRECIEHNTGLYLSL